MYKIKAIPPLTGADAEYFRELQQKMRQAQAKDHTDWKAVGEGVRAMMMRAGKEAWDI